MVAYYLLFVSTILIATASSDDVMSVFIRKISTEPVQLYYVTQVYRSKRNGMPRSKYFLYKKEYTNLEKARFGHNETVRLPTHGRLRFEKRERVPTWK